MGGLESDFFLSGSHTSIRWLVGEPELANRAERVLRSKGFTVSQRARVRGSSGFLHEFALLAEKGVFALLLDFAEKPLDILAFLAKAIDLKGYITIIAAREDLLAEIAPTLGGYARGNIIVYKDAEDFERKLLQALG